MRRQVIHQNGLNYFTFTIVKWIDIFTRAAYRQIVLDSLDYCRRHKGMKVHAFVIMDNHVHAILSTDNEEGISPLLRDFKSYTAKQILAYLEDYRNIESRRDWILSEFKFQGEKSSTNREHMIWQRPNHPTLLSRPDVIYQKLNYIHQNPVKAKIVREAHHYLCSSASNYRNGSGVIEVDLMDGFYSHNA